MGNKTKIMKGVNSKRVASFEDVNRELDNLRSLLRQIPQAADATSGSLFPIAGLIMASTDEAVEGCLPCDGSTYASADYPRLFAKIGNPTWGNSVTSATFKTPDLRAATIRGVGTSTIFTQNNTITKAQVINDQIQGHHHYLNGYGGQNSYNVSPGSGYGLCTVNTLLEVQSPDSDGTNGTPRTGNETTGKAIGMHWVITF